MRGDNLLKRKKQKINTYLKDIKIIRKEAKKILGRELMIYFFTVFEYDDFKEYSDIKKRYDFGGYEHNPYSFMKSFGSNVPSKIIRNG